jgi:hypothetical protein
MCTATATVFDSRFLAYSKTAVAPLPAIAAMWACDSLSVANALLRAKQDQPSRPQAPRRRTSFRQRRPLAVTRLSTKLHRLAIET